MYSFDSSISIIHLIWWGINILSIILIWSGTKKNIKYFDYKKKINGKQYLSNSGMALLLIYFAIFISDRVNITESYVSIFYYFIISIFALVGTLKFFLAGINRIYP